MIDIMIVLMRAMVTTICDDGDGNGDENESDHNCIHDRNNDVSYHDNGERLHSDCGDYLGICQRMIIEMVALKKTSNLLVIIHRLRRLWMRQKSLC